MMRLACVVQHCKRRRYQQLATNLAANVLPWQQQQPQQYSTASSQAAAVAKEPETPLLQSIRNRILVSDSEAV
jgi:pyruvate dehydrogenase complex dehydrogenase (E1) component